MPHGDPHKSASAEASKPLLESESPSTTRERERDLGSQFTITTTGAFAPTPSASTPPSVALAERRKTAGRLVARIGVTAACVAVAILLPEFERLMAFLGSFTTFFICVLLPVSRSFQCTCTHSGSLHTYCRLSSCSIPRLCRKRKGVGRGILYT